jgi:outer membrane immunogenic protein
MNSQHRDMHMRKVLLKTAALAALMAGEGYGADLPRAVMKAPPAPLPFTSWTGCYVAGGGGYGFWNEKTSVSQNGVLIGGDVTSGGRGGFGTVGGGCDLQVSGSWVIGVFGDYDFGSISGDVTVPLGAQLLFGHEKLTSAWAVGGRIGYLITPSILTYVSGVTPKPVSPGRICSSQLPRRVPRISLFRRIPIRVGCSAVATSTT